ncbi:acyl-CoA dehydrogenase family protein [Saccharopolyspora sp. NPDC047091]|uniref:acyl-CoA dehydrogenase family protein n=1 Tax=Saccharopolyspora sp. NPDC047091 TaxID=3155924 RepID=UPI0033EE67F3
MTTPTPIAADPVLPGSPELAGLIAEIAAGSAERAAQDRNPHEQIDLLRRARLGAITLPVSEGGPGASVRDLLSVVIDLAEADPNVAHALRAHFWQVNELLRALPPGPRRQHWLDEVRAGKFFGNANSERGGRAAGAFSFATGLTRTADGFRLNGEKFYSTGTLFADHIGVSAQLDENSVAAVLVPVDREGVTVLDDWDGIGQTRTGTGTTVFDDVSIAEHEVIDVRVTDGSPRPSSDVAQLQLYLQAIVAGILRSVATDAAALIRGRTRSFQHAPTASPADDPILHAEVGRISSAAYVAEAAVLAAADEIDAAYRSERLGAPDRELFTAASLAASKVKVHVDAIALQAATDLFEVGGASSASRSRNLDRHWRNIRTLTLHNPTAYKAAVVGDVTINGSPLPVNGYF